MTLAGLSHVAAALRPWLPREARAHRILTGPIRGARIVTSWHDYPAGIVGLTERPLLDWFSRNVFAGETWLDVGAHYGYTAIALSRLVAKAGRVFAFEPMPGTVACLEETRSLNGLKHLTVVPRALGSPETVTRVRVFTTRGMADGTLGGDPATNVATIQVIRFDSIWPQIQGGNPRLDGVKIDVQGMELETLAGMRETLARHRPKLVIELHRGVSREALIIFLEDLGYSPVPYDIDGARSGSSLRLHDDQSYAFLPAA